MSKSMEARGTGAPDITPRRPCPPWCNGASCDVDDRGRRLHSFTVGWHFRGRRQRGTYGMLGAVRDLSVAVERWDVPDRAPGAPLDGATRVVLMVNDRGEGFVFHSREARALGEALIAGADLTVAAHEYPAAVRDLLGNQEGISGQRAGALAERAKALIRWGARFLAA